MLTYVDIWRESRQPRLPRGRRGVNRAVFSQNTTPLFPPISFMIQVNQEQRNHAMKRRRGGEAKIFFSESVMNHVHLCQVEISLQENWVELRIDYSADFAILLILLILEFPNSLMIFHLSCVEAKMLWICITLKVDVVCHWNCDSKLCVYEF